MMRMLATHPTFRNERHLQAALFKRSIKPSWIVLTYCISSYFALYRQRG